MCHPKWKTDIDIEVKAMGNKIKIRKLCRFPCFQEFEAEGYICEFLEYNFHNYFDGLIGCNILNDLHAVIDYSNKKIQLNNVYLDLLVQENHLDLGIHNLIPMNLICPQARSSINELIQKFEHIFYKEGQDLSFTSEIKHRIITKNDLPIYSKTYKYPEIHKDEVNRQIAEMLDQGIIRHSKSPYNSPLWVVQKKMDQSNKQKWRLVVDYRKLNKETIEDRFPIPNIDEIFDKLGDCKIFSTLDLAKGFYQIEMDNKDVHKTAFSTTSGHYEFLRMPFGLRNAPSTFQRLMNNILSPYTGQFCIVYMDDILIFSKNIGEHVNHLSCIFSCLSKANLKLQSDKCEFAREEIEFLGHTINSEGLKPSQKKIDAICKINLPTNQKQIKSFLGITGYLRRYIKDYSKIAQPLIKYLKKNSKINTHDQEYVEAFQKLKILITSDPIVVYPDFNKQFTIVTDASNYALGAVLMQDNKVISYASRSLKNHELNYSTIEKELLAIYWSTKFFKYYIYGRKFIIKTDHRPLVWLNNLKEPNLKLQRWKVQLNEFDFDITFIKGKENALADGLSRIVKASTEEYDKNAQTNIEINNLDIFMLENTNTLPEVTPKTKIINEDFSKDLIHIFANDIDDLETIHSADSDDLNFISITTNCLNVFKIQIQIIEAESDLSTFKILHNKKIRHIFKSSGNQENMLKFMQEKLPEKGLVVIFCENLSLFVKFQEIYRQYFSSNKNLRILKSGTLLEDINDKEKLLKIIENEHIKNNHRGINEIFISIREKYYYPKMQKFIQNYINNCKICNLAKYDRQPIKYNFNITETPDKINDIIHIDIWYPKRNIMYVTSIDKMSKYATAQHIKDRSWISLLNAIKLRIQYLGKPKKIVTDNEFDIVVIKQFLLENNIDIHFTTPYKKTGNSDVERLHLTLNEHMRLYNADPNNFDTIQENVYKAIVCYNNTIHSTTNIRPIDLFNNILCHEDISKLSEKLVRNKQTLNAKQDNINESNFSNIFVKNNQVGKSNPKYKEISNYTQYGNYLINNKDNKRKIYKDQVKRKYKYQNEDCET